MNLHCRCLETFLTVYDVEIDGAEFYCLVGNFISLTEARMKWC